VHRFCVVALSLGLVMGGCGKEGPTSPPSVKANHSSTTSVGSLPATLEGQLTLDHSNDWGVWGTFTVSGTEYHVAIPASIYDASKLGDDGGKARLTLSAKGSESGMEIYQVSAAEKR
jgi:hypothetical protein